MKVHMTGGFRIHHSIIKDDKSHVNFLHHVEEQNKDLLVNKDFVSFSEDALKSKNAAGEFYYIVVFANPTILEAWQQSLGENKICSIRVSSK